ncbi:nephrin isoform X1 [Lingula anatina]|uniref:Nephrin isoform X1 n=1 Tax=Lingula anatina TaxID=7574 RepID=A0A1S3H2H2_LINAN|nr:nephrin isoform X1 [Lingula anatina]|eukprot:XP_013380213.1 nephrin isoform X1 [Lingula anatina]
MKGTVYTRFLLAFCCACTVLLAGAQNVIQSFRVMPNDTSVIAGETAVLKCEVDSMQGMLQWAKDGFALGFDRSIIGYPRYSMVGSVTLGQHNLMITNTDLSDDADFECQVTPSQNNPHLKAKAHLYVMVPPDQPEIEGHTNGSTVEVLLTDITVNLTCNAMNGKPAPGLIWKRNGRDVTETVQYSTYSSDPSSKRVNAKSIITLNPVKEDNGALYSCQATHPALRNKVLETVIKLSVLYEPGHPVITGYRTNQIIRTGDTVTLSCKSEGGNPLARVVWYKNNIQIDYSFTTGDNMAVNDLVVNADASDNNAEYKCEVSNVVTQAPKVAAVLMKVYFAPAKAEILGAANARAGETIMLSCVSSNSNPAAKITWIAKGQQLSGATERVIEAPEGGYKTYSNLTVPLTDSENDVIYECQATNEALGQMARADVTLRVLYPPNNPVISGYTAGTPIRAKSVQTLSCSASGGNPRATITWWKGDEELPSSDKSVGKIAIGEIQFIAQASDNLAEYRCNATNEATITPLLDTARLTVHFPPEGVTVTQDPPVARAGQRLTLKCSSSSSNPASVVSWKKDNRPIGASSHYVQDAAYGGKSTISEVVLTPSEEDNGENYECEARNEELKQSVHNAIQLNVLFKPRFQGIGSKISIVEGQSTVINFTAQANPGVTQYTWYKESEKLILGTKTKRDLALPHFIVDGGVLNITNVTRADMGNYSCQAQNSEGVGTINFTLDVQYPASISSVVSPVYVDKGDRAFLECQADANPTVPDMIKWTRVDYDMTHTAQVYDAGISRLTVYNVSKTDSGAFVCTAKNGIGIEATKIVELIVKYPPEIEKLEVKSAAELGARGKVVCKAEGAPPVSFTWFKGSEPINVSLARYSVEHQKLDFIHYVTYLYIHNVTEKDYGRYKCVARNDLGSDSFLVRFDKTSKPDPPSKIQMVNSTHDSVTIQWVPGFDGGLPLTYNVRYKVDSKDIRGHLYADTDKTVYTVTGLKLNTAYEFTVRAINREGSSDYSPGIIVKTSSTMPTGPSALGTADEVPLIIILSVCIVGVVLLACNVLLIIFFVRRRRRKMEKDGSESASQANTIEMYAPSDRPLYQNFQKDNYSQGSLDKSMEDFATDSYRSFDDDDDIKRVFIPPQPPVYSGRSLDRDARYAPLRQTHSPAMDKQRNYTLPAGHSGHGGQHMYLDDYPRTDEVPYHGGSLPRLRPQEDEYAHQLRKNQMQKGLNSIGEQGQGRNREGLPTPNGKAPPPPPTRSSSHGRAHIPPLNHPPLPARNYDLNEMPRYTPPPGNTDLRPPSRRSQKPEPAEPLPVEMRGHLV